MILVPHGNDQNVYGRPWLTGFLIALNVAAFVVALVLGRGVDDRIAHARLDLARIHEAHPDARVPPELVATVPARLRGAMAAMIGRDPDDADPADGQAEIERAAKRLVAAIDDRPTYRFGYEPGRPRALSAVTSLFMHVDVVHLAGNMMFLWTIGAVIECFSEYLPYLVLYLVAGLAGVAAHHAAQPDSMTPLVGASGAIAGLLGAFLVGHPTTRFTMLFATVVLRPAWPPIRPVVIPFDLRAWVLVPGWFLMQLGYALVGNGDGVAYWAHVGGFVAGVIGALVMKWGGWVFYDAAKVSAARAP